MRMRIWGSPFRVGEVPWLWEDISSVQPIGTVLEEIITRERGADYLVHRRISRLTVSSRPVPLRDQSAEMVPTRQHRDLDPSLPLAEQNILEGDSLLVLCLDREKESSAVRHTESQMRLRIWGSPFLNTEALWHWEQISALLPIGAVLEEVITRERGADYLMQRRISRITASSRPIPPQDQSADMVPTRRHHDLDPSLPLVAQNIFDGDSLAVLCIERKEASAAVWRAESLISNRFPASPPPTRASCSLAQSRSLHAPAPQLPNVLTQAQLRIFVARAQGSGHQGCSVQLMKSLRRLGFRGLFDVVYDDGIIAEDGERLIGQKLVELLPGYRYNPGNDDVQTFNAFGLNVQVTSLTHFQRTGAPLKHAMTGAFDRDREYADILDKLKVEFFTQLQPMNWTADSGIRKITYRVENEVKVRNLTELFPLGYIYDDPVLSDAAETIRRLLVDGGQLEKVEAVIAFDQLCSQHANYHTQIGYGFSTSMGAGDVLCSLFNLVLGVLRLQDTDHRGVVIGISGWDSAVEIALLNLVFENAPEGGLEVLFKHNREDLAPLQAHLCTRLYTPDNRRRVRVIDIKAASAAHLIASVAPSTVLLVAFGRIPEPVFNHLIKRTSLPNCFESVNGMDRERQNKPYIHVAKEISNKFPASDFVDGVPNPETDEIAQRCMTIGRLFQGFASLDLWVRNYCVRSPEDIFRDIYDMDRAKQKGLKLVCNKVAVLYVKSVDTNPTTVTLQLPDNVSKRLSGQETLKTLLRRNDVALQKFNAPLRQADPDLLIGRFLADALDADTAVRTYFAKLKTISATRDQVRLALDELAKLPGATGAAPTQGSGARTDTPPSSSTSTPREVRDAAVPAAPVRVQPSGPSKRLTLLSLNWVMGSIPARVWLVFQPGNEAITSFMTITKKNVAVPLVHTRIIMTSVNVQLDGATDNQSYGGAQSGLRFYNGEHEQNLLVGDGHIVLRYRIEDA